MAKLVLLRLHVAASELALGRDLERHRLAHREAVSLQPDEFTRVIGQEPHGLHTEIPEDLGADAVVALIRLEPQLDVGLDRIEPLVLKLVGPNFVRQTNAPAFLAGRSRGMRCAESCNLPRCSG